jgi:hypothetical protein
VGVGWFCWVKKFEVKKFLGAIFCFSGCGFVNATGGVGRNLGGRVRLGLVSLGGVIAHTILTVSVSGRSGSVVERT